MRQSSVILLTRLYHPRIEVFAPMPPTRLNVSQLRLGPEVPLGRRGCLVESSRTIEDQSGWDDTVFGTAFAAGHQSEIIRLFRERGEDIFTVTKRVLNDQPPPFRDNFTNRQLVTVDQMVSLGVLAADPLTNRLALARNADWGTALECAILIALDDLHIQGHRDVKVRYPYRDAPYDPDGQKYDVLAGLDLTHLLWVECKKPLYLPGAANPLGQVLTREYVRKFYKRAHYLKPSVAVYLVDTKEDYSPILKSLFSDKFLDAGCYEEALAPANQLMARLHGFIYFVRVDYRTNSDYIDTLRECISQVLHDSRHNWVEIGFSGDPFR